MKKLEIAAFLIICIAVITLAIRAGQHHGRCVHCYEVVSVR